MSVIKDSLFTQVSCPFSTCMDQSLSSTCMDLGLLLLSMLAGFLAIRRTMKLKSKPDASTSSVKPKAQAHKQQPMEARFGFERQSPEVQEACILLQHGKVKSAVSLLQKQPETMDGSVPASAARSILITAMRMPKQETIIKELAPLKGKIPSGALDVLMDGAVKKKDLAECRQLDSLSRSLQITKSQSTLEALAEAYRFDSSALRGLVEEASAPLAKPFAEIVLQACSVAKDYTLAADVMKKVDKSDIACLRGAVEKGTTCTMDHPAQDLKSQRSGSRSPSPRTTSAGSSEAGNSDSDDTPQSQSSDKELKQPFTQDANDTAASYHGLLSARIDAGDQRGAWRVVADMQVNGISPSGVTCSILLKGKPDSVEEVSRVLLLANAMEEPMDEVFFLALAEASIRVGRLDLLSKQIDKMQRQGAMGHLSAKTYGALIQAYGQAHDMKRVWILWNQMATHQIAFTSIALECMVEALVVNGSSTEARNLVKKLHKDETAEPLMNAAIYSSILKGFSSARETEKALQLYKEMKALQMQPDIVTFNALLNAFAQTGSMQHVPAIWEDMRMADPPVQPNALTYSTLVKGYCNAGCLEHALKIFKDMRVDNRCPTDEVVYNLLLGSCAKELRPDEALELLRDMRNSKVTPSTYTLGLIVKLFGRCQRLDEASAVLDDVSKHHGLKINIQVYTSLVQGYLHNGQAGKALNLYERLVSEGAPLPDAMMYTTLVRGCLRLGIADKAVDLVKRAHGIGMTGASFPGLNPGCLDEVIAALGGAEAEQSAALLSDLRRVHATA